MPNRILRDWTDSFKFNGLSRPAEVLFTRLIMKADDFGRYNAHPQLIKSGCYPLDDDLRANTISAWLTELSDRGLVFCYTSRNRPLLAIINFGQRLREGSEPKFDAPENKPKLWLAGESAAGRGGTRRDAAGRGLDGDGGGGVFGDEGGGGVGADAPAREDELPTEAQAVALTATSGIPEPFTRYVYGDWASRQGKDAGGVLVKFLPYVVKRWTREQVEWKAKTHKGTKEGRPSGVADAILQQNELKRIEERLKAIRSQGSTVAGGGVLFTEKQKKERAELLNRKVELLKALGFKA